jgi:hypothetical protein
MFCEQVAIDGARPQENKSFASYALIQQLGLYRLTIRCRSVTPGSIVQPS